MPDPVPAHWIPNEVEEEASHLLFLFLAMKEYLPSGAPEELDCCKRQLVRDIERLLEKFWKATV